MPRETSLFERLARPSGSGARAATDSTSKMVQSILRHLRRMLNTRQGFAPAQPDYGIPDPLEVMHNHADAIQRIQKAIKACVEKYEPRLANVGISRIESDEDVLTLRFRITGQVVTAKDRVPVLFDTQIDPSGRIRVKE
ncbi:MAG: type VI secretion system baseplate subunit TssE [Planctomycetes bacterium]|nr:type VI secretion system baseplate subunit TssE [Planctomycetota bacterium]